MLPRALGTLLQIPGRIFLPDRCANNVLHAVISVPVSNTQQQHTGLALDATPR